MMSTRRPTKAVATPGICAALCAKPYSMTKWRPSTSPSSRSPCWNPPGAGEQCWHVSDHGLAVAIVRIYEQGEHPSLRNQLGKQFEPLGYQLDGKNTDARDVAARPGETRDESVSDGVAAGGKDNWNGRGRLFCRPCAWRSDRGDHLDLRSVANAGS
jgi:hypothetical protein